MNVQLRILLVASAALLVGVLWSQAPGGSPAQQGQPGNMQTGPAHPDSSGMATPGSLPDQQPVDQRAADKKFVKDAAEGSMTEVELGKLAQEKGSSDAVKDFGKRMIQDHAKATEDLKQAAAKANLQIPADTPKRAKKAQEKLSKLTGTEFDRAYARMMLRDHKNDVRDFDNEARNGNIPEVKQFAANTLPTLQEHLKLAEQLDTSTRPEVTDLNSKASGGNNPQQHR